ncbi:hypothetical protein [Aphanothece minutissima]|uniref:hypothetical protein n=1 Tax=Aphanothece minutissima TaxID=543815 RepID=UPI0011B276C7|nr:hypothetical protein [Aphanothece minutissima]
MSNQNVSSWAVPLKGHLFDIEDLPLYLNESPVAVIKSAEKYWLILSKGLAGETHDGVLEIAERYLTLINGAASLLIDGYRPIELEGGVFHGLDDDGEIAQVVVPAGTIEVRCKFGHVTISAGGEPRLDDRIGSMSRIINDATGSQAKADALTILGRSSPSWSELYLAFELVKANVGSRMFTAKWINQTDATLFTRTANSYTALGSSGRHGRDRGDPPTEPMEKQDALVLVRSLVASWFRDPWT